MELSDVNGKVLIEYKRKSRRRPTATMVAIGPGIIGWSICDNRDTFNKKIGLRIALERANKAYEMDLDEFEDYLKAIPSTLQSLAAKIIDRSFLYYKN